MTVDTPKPPWPAPPAERRRPIRSAAVRGVLRGTAAGVAALGALVVLASPALASSPNPAVTPGATDPLVTQANVATTICRRGYAKTVRKVTTQEKHTVYLEYAISGSARHGYVIDHLVPLEVGGANVITNLWPQPKAEAKVKDKLEGQMHTAVCNGSVTLAAAQARFLTGSEAGPPATAPPPTQPPTTAPPAPASPQVVHPGAFCDEGQTGVTDRGTPMVCGPASDSEDRWHAA
jgi:hypothetical protein